MIDKSWFDLEKCRVVDEDLESKVGQNIDIVYKNRNFQLYVYIYKPHFKDSDDLIRIGTDVVLLENDTQIASYIHDVLLSTENNIPIDGIKFIFQEWLLEEIQLEKLKAKFTELEILEIYQYYLRGKEGLKEYELKDIRKRLDSDTRRNRKQGIELFDVYTKSKILKPLFPYISLGRLCFSLSEDKKYEFHCIYFSDEKYVVSNYGNTTKYHFNSAEETIAFLEKKFESH